MSNTTAFGFTLIPGLVTALQALNSTAWTAFDGNASTGDTPQTYVVVGSNSAGEVLDYTQDWHSEGLQPEREEHGVVYCKVVSSDGSMDQLANCRNRVRDAIADLDATVRAYDNTALVWALVTSSKVRDASTPNGLQFEADVEVSYYALLTNWP